MNINQTGSVSLLPSASTSVAAPTGATSTQSTLAGYADLAGGNGSISQVDFTSMTRSQMRDWVNNQIRSGQMTLDDSTAFVGMTMKVSVETGQPVDAATDTERVNFVDKALQGIDGALSRNDQDSALRLENALTEMMSKQGQITGINVLV